MIDTATAGGVIGGYWAIGKEDSAIPPVRVMKMDSTAAKIGRSMKKREIMVSPYWLPLGGLRRLPVGGRAERRHGHLVRPDLHLGPNLLQPADDHPVVRL